MSHSLQVILLLAVIVAAAKAAGIAANRLGQPSVFGQILAGVLLGPTCLDVLGLPLFSSPAVEGGSGLLPLVRDFGELGVLLLMFVAGLETDLAEMRRVGKVAFWAALGGVTLPMLGGALLAVAFGFPLYWEGLFIGTILTATSVSISAQTLLELGALRSREGSTILGAAVIDDVMGIVVLSVVVAFASASADGVNGLGIGFVVVRMALFFVIALIVGRWIGPLLRLVSRFGANHGVLSAVLVLTLLYAWAAEYVGAVAAITGAYLAGLFIAQTEFKQTVEGSLHPLAYALFVPVFFIGIGLQADARELGSQALFTITLVLVAIATKAVGCGVGASLAGFSTIESVRVGAGMISRGEVGLIVAGYGLAHGLIGEDMFAASVVMVLVTTMVTPPLLRLVIPRGPALGATA